jgi:C_GCAxxG_C_C family probable redox protein
MNKSEKGCNAFMGGFNCSQSVLTAFSHRFNIERETALRISCGFGAGFGREQETCGAVSGGVMVIGLMYGQYEPDDRESKEKTYSLVKSFIQSFREANGTSLCSELTGCDLTSESGVKKFNEEKIKENVCLRCINDAIGLLEDIIE